MVTQGDCEASSSSSNVTQPSTVKEEESKAENGRESPDRNWAWLSFLGNSFWKDPWVACQQGKDLEV